MRYLRTKNYFSFQFGSTCRVPCSQGPKVYILNLENSAWFDLYLFIMIFLPTFRTLFKCEQCDRSFLRRSILNKHVEEEHNAAVSIRHQCTQCIKHYKSKALLRIHMEANHTSAVAPCPHCNKEFRHKSYLRQHLRGHCPAQKDQQNQTKSNKS